MGLRGRREGKGGPIDVSIRGGGEGERTGAVRAANVVGGPAISKRLACRQERVRPTRNDDSTRRKRVIFYKRVEVVKGVWAHEEGRT